MGSDSRRLIRLGGHELFWWAVPTRHNLTGQDTGVFCPPLPAFLHAADFNFIYEVGSGKPYETPGDIPWENLKPSSLILIGYRQQPYANKWVISTTGSAEFPIVACGVLSETGKRPVISGDGAGTRHALDYWNENRSVLKIGGSSHLGEPPASPFATVYCVLCDSANGFFAGSQAKNLLLEENYIHSNPRPSGSGMDVGAYE